MIETKISRPAEVSSPITRSQVISSIPMLEKWVGWDSNPEQRLAISSTRAKPALLGGRIRRVPFDVDLNKELQ
jgi:hypothetical protein